MILSDDFKPSKLLDYIAEKHRDAMKETAMNLGKGSTLKDLPKWDDFDRKPFRFSKGTPAHYKAGLAYNDLFDRMEINDKFLFNKFRIGDKIRWVYLRKNPYGLKTIGFPMEDCPIELSEFANAYINRKHQWEAEFTKKAEVVLNCIGLSMPSQNFSSADQEQEEYV